MNYESYKFNPLGVFQPYWDDYWENMDPRTT